MACVAADLAETFTSDLTVVLTVALTVALTPVLTPALIGPVITEPAPNVAISAPYPPRHCARRS